jgi:hypothetical protein
MFDKVQMLRNQAGIQTGKAVPSPSQLNEVCENRTNIARDKFYDAVEALARVAGTHQSLVFEARLTEVEVRLAELRQARADSSKIDNGHIGVAAADQPHPPRSPESLARG